MSVLIILLGLSLLIYSLCEINVYVSLYFDRDVYSIEAFRKAEKAGDAAACLHNLAKAGFGLLLLLTGAGRLVQQDLPLGGVFVAVFVLTCLDALLLEVTIRRFRLKESMAAIQAQWRREKRISANHNHEVDMFRSARALTQKYPRQILIISACMIALRLLMM